VPLRAEDVDIVFAAPDKEWSGRLTRSTVNLFLFDVRRSVKRAVSASTTREQNGVHSRVRLAPFVKVRYLVTVWTKEPADEHRVLGDLLSLLAIEGEVPAKYLVGELSDLGNAAEISLGNEDSNLTSGLWGPLGVAPRANLEFSVVLPARRLMETVVPPPPTEVVAGVSDQNQPTRRSGVRRLGGVIEYPDVKGARIIGPRGSGVIDESGGYLLPAEPGDELTVDVDPPIHVVAGPPSD
jgi:hypothetical protein